MSSNLRKAVLITAMTVGIAAAAVVLAAAPQASGFPDGPGKAIVEGNCGSCHDLDLVKQAKHDEKAWAETISHMVNYGASVPDAQVPTLAAYLAKAFPVNGAVKTDDKKEDPDVVGERILNTACTTCHDLGPVTRRADDKASWEGIVYGMVGNGADVKDADIPVLVDYLVKHYGPPKTAPAATPAAPARGGAPAQGGARGGAGK